ncbi:hypothetical protein OG211_16190 [Streptomyces niveus]|nr:hypothetical protein OG211_16190 [Streptomyces niveus]
MFVGPFGGGLAAGTATVADGLGHSSPSPLSWAVNTAKEWKTSSVLSDSP